MAPPSLINLVLFLGISQGVFLAVTLQLVQKKNRSANLILSLLLIMSAVMLTGRLYYYVYYEIDFFARLSMLVDSIIFLFGPLLYVYVKRMMISFDYKPRLKWYEFIPSLLHLCYVFWSFFYTVTELKELYQEGFFVIPFFITELVSIIMLVTYVIKCFILLQRFRLAEEKILSFHQEVYHYLFSFVFVVGLLTVFWVLNFIKVYVLNSYDMFFDYNFMWACIPIVIYVVGFYSFKQPEVFRIPVFIAQKNTFKSRLSKAKIEILTNSLEQLLVTDRIYLNPDLTLAGLAKELKTSTNDLSWLLNKIHKCSFYEYINQYRVQEFIAKIHKGEHEQHTILALSFDAGFNSKSTFNKAFKMVLNDTPSNYIRKMSKI